MGARLLDLAGVFWTVWSLVSVATGDALLGHVQFGIAIGCWCLSALLRIEGRR